MINKIIKFSEQFSPLSVFLYGSQATGETTPNSDYEVGLIFDDEKYISRREIKAKQDFDGVSFYPFRLSELRSYTLDTPFPKKLFVYWLIKSGKTILGDDIISQIEIPEITKLDLVGAIGFEIGISFCSFLNLRQGNRFLAHDEFSKSCLHGLKLLIFVESGEFLTTYKDVHEFSKKMDLPDEYREVIDAAYNFRQNSDDVDDNLIYKNMSFLGFVERQIIEIEGSQ